MASKLKELLKKDLIVPLLLLIYCSTYFFEVSSLPNPEQALLLIKPVFIILAIAVVLHVVLQFTLFNKKENNHVREEPFKLKRSVIFAVATLVYILLIDVIGFVVTTFIYSSLLMYLLGEKRLMTLFVIPIVFIIILFMSLEVGLKIPLPKGFLI